MRCKGRVFRDTGQGAKIIVVLIMLIVIFRKQITDIVSSAFKNINGDSDTINEEIEIDDGE